MKSTTLVTSHEWARGYAKGYADALELAAHVAEHLNGWGSPPAPKLADHIAKCIRALARGEG